MFCVVGAFAVTKTLKSSGNFSEKDSGSYETGVMYRLSDHTSCSSICPFSVSHARAFSMRGTWALTTFQNLGV
jgi:hypothetical protein